MKKMNKHMKQVGDIKDRGVTKWQGLFLPEHVEMIRAWREEDNRVDKPELDEWDLQAIQEELELSSKRKCEVRIQIWKDWEFHHHTGIVEGVDYKKMQITYRNSSGLLHRLEVSEVTSIDLLE